MFSSLFVLLSVNFKFDNLLFRENTDISNLLFRDIGIVLNKTGHTAYTDIKHIPG